MTRLDDTISVGQGNHIGDHQVLARKANYVFDVKDYGAVGDGVTDDTAAIQAAVDASQDTDSGVTGGEILFPPGEYVISDAILINDFSGILRGFGVGNSPVYATPSAVDASGNSSVIAWHGDAATPMFLLTDYRYVKFVDLRIEGSTATPPTYGIESRSSAAYVGGSGANLVVEDVHIGRFPWTTRGTNEGDVKVGIGFTGTNVNNDEYKFSRVNIVGCETGISLLNSQTVAGSFQDVGINTASVVGITAATTIVAFNLTFNACQIDLSLTGTGQTTVYGWYSENSGLLLSTPSNVVHPVSVVGGWWVISSTLGLGAGDYFVNVGLAGGFGGGVSLYGVRIVNNTDSDLRASSYGASAAADTPGLVQLVGCNTAGFTEANIIIDDGGGHNETLLRVVGCREIPNMTKLVKDGGAIPTTPIHEFEGEAMIDGDLNHDGTKVGFYGTAPVTKPEITGARDDGTALADLLTKLAALGLIVDSTTAT